MFGKKKVRKGCLISMILVGLFCVGLVFGIMRIMENPEQYNKKSEMMKMMELTSEQEDAIMQVFNETGIGEVKSVKLFNEGEENSSYYVSTSNVSDIVVWISKDKIVTDIYYANNDIYIDGDKKANVTDFYMSSEERAIYRVTAEDIIKENLTSPSTAKFAPAKDWNYKKEGDISVIAAYVDSQNAFGATLRTNFQFTFENKNITSLIIDGVEYVD